MLSGSFRRVFLLGRFAVKVPRIRFLSLGMRCHRWEREMWCTWRPVFGWTELCPIVLADPLGMPRAVTQPVSLEEIKAASSDHTHVVIDCAPDDWGRVDGCARVVDYGLPFARARVAPLAAQLHHWKKEARRSRRLEF
jgi:hypothetical protein